MGDVEEQLEVAVLAGRRVRDGRLAAPRLREVRKDPLRVVAVVEAVRVRDPALAGRAGLRLLAHPVDACHRLLAGLPRPGVRDGLAVCLLYTSDAADE